MTSRELDIVGQPCDACDNDGVAKVVHFVTSKGKDRFFYGCSASTEAVPCKGSKVWNSIQVPVALQADALPEERRGAARKSKPESKPKGSRKRAAKVSADDAALVLVEEEEVKTETTTQISTSVTTRKRKSFKALPDATQWTKRDDDDYCE